MKRRTTGVIPLNSAIGERIPNQTIVISDDNAGVWAPAALPEHLFLSVEEGGTAEDLPNFSPNRSPLSPQATEQFRYITRTALVFRLRSSGLSHDDIASLLHDDPSIAPLLPSPYGPRQVAEDITSHVEHMREEIAESLESVVAIETHRFDQMVESLWPAILDGNVNAINTALRVSEARRRMLGLDQPIQVDWKVELSTLLLQGRISLEDIESQLESSVFGQFMQYLESRNERLTTANEGAPNAKAIDVMYRDATPAGRFSSPAAPGKEEEAEAENDQKHTEAAC